MRSVDAPGPAGSPSRSRNLARAEADRLRRTSVVYRIPDQPCPTASPLRGPSNRIEEQHLERAVLEQIGFVSELEVHVPRFVVRIRPDDRMIAHLHGARRHIAVLIDVCEHVCIGPGRSVVGVPTRRSQS